MRSAVGVFLVCLAAGGAGSCAEPDPTYGPPGGIKGKSIPGGAAGTTTSGADGGTTTETPPGTAPKSLFNGPYSATTPAAPAAANSLRAKHAAAQPPGPTPAAISDCMAPACHGGMGSQGQPTWVAAGRVGPATGGTPNADVIIVDGSSALAPVKTDADGFFWFPTSSGTVTPTSHVAVRTADHESQMTGALTTGGSCLAANSCHGGTQGAITP